MWHYIGWDMIYIDAYNEELLLISGNRMSPPHFSFALSVGHTFHAVMSFMVILQFMSLHAVSHCQSYTHAVLHVGFTEDRNPGMRISSVASDLPPIPYDRWAMGRKRCVTRVIQSCLSNHMCLVFTMVTCSRVYCFSHCTVFQSAWFVCPMVEPCLMERRAVS